MSEGATIGDTPLFLTDKGLHEKIAPHIGEKRFRSALRVLEARGFPAIHPLFGGRYWPNVRAWLDNENGVQNGLPVSADDGQENFDGDAEREPGPEMAADCQRPTALLGRAPGRARHAR